MVLQASFPNGKEAFFRVRFPGKGLQQKTLPLVAGVCENKTKN